MVELLSAFILEGGEKLMGELSVQGAKNAVLPVLAGTILNRGISIIHNCPKIIDVQCMVKILRAIGCSIGIRPINQNGCQYMYQW